MPQTPWIRIPIHETGLVTLLGPICIRPSHPDFSEMRTKSASGMLREGQIALAHNIVFSINASRLFGLGQKVRGSRPPYIESGQQEHT